MGWGHSGFHSWVTLGDSWAGGLCLGRGCCQEWVRVQNSRSTPSSRLEQTMLLSVYSASVSLVLPVPGKEAGGCQQPPLAGEPHALHHRSSLCTWPVYQKTKAQHLPSRSSGLMRERHMTNLSAALQCVQKVCSKEKGATHFVWQASEGTFRKVETWGKAAQTE